jgi:hypothetical protein
MEQFPPPGKTERDHFDQQIVYTLRFMTHAEYSKEKWKDRL